MGEKWKEMGLSKGRKKMKPRGNRNKGLKHYKTSCYGNKKSKEFNAREAD